MSAVPHVGDHVSREKSVWPIQRRASSDSGWLPNGEYVWLYEPHASFESWEVWADLELTDRPGMIPIGSDGSREVITVDGRDPRSAVTLTCIVSEGWKDATLQTPSVEAFVDAVEAGTFAFVFGD